MPTIPSSMAPLIDQYMRETGQTTDSHPICHNDNLGSQVDTKPGKRDFAPPSFVHLEDTAIWTLPVHLESEANRRGSVKGQSARNRTVKNAVYRALGPYWKVFGPMGDRLRAGLPCVIRAVRLGGRGLDVNGLWASMKFPEDAIANLMGLDDRLPAWKQSFSVDQEPGRLYGLRIEMRDGTPRTSVTSGKAEQRLR